MNISSTQSKKFKCTPCQWDPVGEIDLSHVVYKCRFHHHHLSHVFFCSAYISPRHSGLAENDRDYSDNVPRFMRVIVVTMEGTNWILSLSSGKYIILERLGQHSKSYGTIQIKRGAVSAHCPPFSEKLHSCAHSDRVLWLTTCIHSDHLRGRLFGKYLSALIVSPSNPTFNCHFQQEYEYLFACLVCLYSE